MLNERLADFVHQQMQTVFDDDLENILSTLTKAAEPDELDEKTVKLLTTAMFMASQYSALYMLHFLNNNGILNLPGDNEPFLWTQGRSSSVPPGPPVAPHQE